MKNRPENLPPDNDIQMSAAHPDRFGPPRPEVTPPARNEVPGNLPPVKG